MTDDDAHTLLIAKLMDAMGYLLRDDREEAQVRVDSARRMFVRQFLTAKTKNLP